MLVESNKDTVQDQSSEATAIPTVPLKLVLALPIDRNRVPPSLQGTRLRWDEATWLLEAVSSKPIAALFQEEKRLLAQDQETLADASATADRTKVDDLTRRLRETQVSLVEVNERAEAALKEAKELVGKSKSPVGAEKRYATLRSEADVLANRVAALEGHLAAAKAQYDQAQSLSTDSVRRDLLTTAQSEYDAVMDELETMLSTRLPKLYLLACRVQGLQPDRLAERWRASKGPGEALSGMGHPTPVGLVEQPAVHGSGMMGAHRNPGDARQMDLPAGVKMVEVPA
jgi:hypothetical protein